MNVRFGNSETVHNTLSICVERVDGELVKTPVPTCSVAFHGKERHETADAVTCKTCAKRVKP